VRSYRGLFNLQRTAFNLVALDALKQGCKITFAEAFVLLALDEFEVSPVSIQSTANDGNFAPVLLKNALEEPIRFRFNVTVVETA